MILQHRQGRALVLAIGLPRAGLGTLTKAGVRCVKEVVVLMVRGGGGGRRRFGYECLTNKEAPNSGRQDIGIYVGDRESGPGTRIYVEKSGHGPGSRPKGAPSTKKWCRYVFQVLKVRIFRFRRESNPQPTVCEAKVLQLG